MLKVVGLSIEEKSIKRTKELDKYDALLKKHGYPSAYDMLPKNKWHRVEFKLTNTNSGFANAIRRSLIEEIPVKHLTIDETDINSDDEFIASMKDVIEKNIHLLPIYQEGLPADVEISLMKHNDTNDTIDVKASDMTVTKKSGKKTGRGENAVETIDESVDESVEEVEADVPSNTTAPSTTAPESDEKTTSKSAIKPGSSKGSKLGGKVMTKSTTASQPSATTLGSADHYSIDKIMPETNILIARLRAGKYLKMSNITFGEAIGHEDASKGSLLNTVTYAPIDVTPYDSFKSTGTRSIEHDCKEFVISFETCGNIKPDTVMHTVCNNLEKSLTDIREKITAYAKTDTSATYYTGQNITVSNNKGMYCYKLDGYYFTVVNMIAMRCYLLDPNLLHASGAVERYDTERGIIKLKHAEPNKLLISAIDACIADLKTVMSMF